MKIALILFGGALGSLARYGVSGWVHQKVEGTFPLGTLSVNLIGSFLIGLLWGIAESSTINPHVRTFLFVGILGGFTTFSTYSLETLNLMRDGEFKMALINLLLNNIVGIVLAFAGMVIARNIST